MPHHAFHQYGWRLSINGQKNLWGEPLAFLELESEHSSASTCEGFASADGRVANFTSGQGLILMKEVLYVIAGKRLPAVFHIGARAFDFARAEHSFMPATTTSWAWSTAAGACCSGAMSRKPQISR